MLANPPSAQPVPGSRFFNDPTNSPYLLPADTEEGRRLNEQHEVITRAAAGKLIMAPVQLGDGDKVLDCATGTGMWLMELASKTPTHVSFSGIDISPYLFPSQDNTPANVSFLQHSVFSLPDSFLSQYTLVNQRLVSAAFRADEWPQALHTYFHIVRPGGWVQLCEIHPPGFAPKGPCTARMLGIHGSIAQARGLDNDCAIHIADWAKNAGFVNVQTLCTRAPVGARAGDGPHNYTKSALSFFRAMKEVVLKHGIVDTEEQYEQGVQDMEDEWNALESPSYPYYWIWGQKPLRATL